MAEGIEGIEGSEGPPGRTRALQPPSRGVLKLRKWPVASEMVAAAGLGAFATAFLLNPHTIADGPVLCPFRRLTGLPCPGCGLTRSWVYLAHGWWRESVVANPFGIVLVALVVGLGAYAVRQRIVRQPAPDLDSLVRRPWLIGVVVLWLTFAVVRIVVDAAT